MIEPRLFVCGGVREPRPSAATRNRKVISLNAFGADPSVTIKITDVARVFTRNLSPRMTDLLEIASYVFTGDAGTRRGTAWQNDSEEPWGRDLRFVIPVRDHAFWRQPAVAESLTKTLGFLSNDAYSFDFRPSRLPGWVEQGFLELGTEDWPFKDLDRVIMFSGGLDSLAGSVEAAAGSSGPLVLVSHRSVPQISARQQTLYRELKNAFPHVPMLHVPVWVNKANRFGHEPTQRTRSFLFTALGICVGSLVGAKGVRFYENGVVSLNLPVADEVVRARASRTTHPHALRLLSDFATLVTGATHAIDNPFLHRTKSEIVATIAAHGVPHLIGHSVSCAHTMYTTVSQQHCGTCSQCIDRRIGVLGADCGAFDLQSDYVSDVFTGPRGPEYERTMAVHYARHALELRTMSSVTFASRFNVDLTRAVRGEPDSSAAVDRLFDLHQRRAQTVHRVIANAMAANADRLTDAQLEPTSLLALIADRQHKRDMWGSYAARIGDLLAVGLPISNRANPAKNEPHLQELSEAILQTHDDTIDREFPFMRWSGATTKGDFAKESLHLWIELKYVRQKRDILAITEDIAADITKYGDNGLRVLFVVYDPKHLIINDALFAHPIEQRPTMIVRFIR